MEVHFVSSASATFRTDTVVPQPGRTWKGSPSASLIASSFRTLSRYLTSPVLPLSFPVPLIIPRLLPSPAQNFVPDAYLTAGDETVCKLCQLQSDRSGRLLRIHCVVSRADMGHAGARSERHHRVELGVQQRASQGRCASDDAGQLPFSLTVL